MKVENMTGRTGREVANQFVIRVEVLGDGVKTIAKATYGKTDEEAATNAHLIAAAPELLEACHSAYNKLVELETEAGHSLFIGEELNELERAINKAEMR